MSTPSSTPTTTNPPTTSAAPSPTPSITLRRPNRKPKRLTTPQIDAYYASLAEEMASAHPQTTAHLGSDRNTIARKRTIRTSLIPLYMERFDMDFHQARVAVAMDVVDKYPTNVWDDPEGDMDRRLRAGLGVGVTERKKEVEGEDKEEEKAGESGYSEEQWDLFERTFC